MAATATTAVFAVSNQPLFVGNGNTNNLVLGNSLISNPLSETRLERRGRYMTAAAATVTATPKEETKECIGGMQGEKLRIFYNPAAVNLDPHEEFGIAFNGGFNQPIMCGGEPRVMLKKTRGKADPSYYTIQICVPKHALNLIFSFTNGTDWDGPYKLQFQVPNAWRNKPINFFNEGLAEELSKDGACDKAIFPDTDIVVTRCAMIGNLTVQGGDRCNLDFEHGCTDPGSPMYNPLATIDDGSSPPYSDSEYT